MSATQTTTTEIVNVPYKLDRAADGSFVAGRGAAGWTVAAVPLSSLGAFLAALPPAAWMPGTGRCPEVACHSGRLERQGGGAAPEFYGCNHCEFCAEI
jgi:hypothetical protein